MIPESRRYEKEVTPEERQELLEAKLLYGVPELTFTPRGDPDPRLVQIAGLLGKQMAREEFKAQMSKRGSNGS